MSAGGFMFSFPTFWRFHDHSGDPACDCCAKTPQQQTVVVKRRRVLSVSHGDGDGRSTVLDTPTSSPAASGETGAELESSHEPQQSPVDIREAESDVVEKQQSPIDIHEGDSDLVPMGSCVNAVTIAMGNGEAEIDYDGHGFHVVWSTAGNNTLTIGDKVFHAIQFHFHTPSEHTLDGVHEELELHLVHRAADGSFAVLGVLIREGKTNAFLSQFWDKLAGLEHDVPTKVPVGTINPKDLDLASSSFFRYRGSLTTPPYTEGVEWVVVHDVMEASREQLDAFHRALPGTNARDLQSLNHRHVMFAC